MTHEQKIQLWQSSLLDAIKKQWIADYGDLNNSQKWDGYTLVGFIDSVLSDFAATPPAPKTLSKELIKMEEKLQNHPALSESATFSPTDHDKGFVLGWRLCYEWVFDKEEVAPPAPEAEVVPESLSRIAVCNACNNEKHGVRTRIAVPHTCGR